ncbi:hypothetical protein [Pseudomonas sp. PA15(2017)]|uniref:hypothetical protein n=1 Tax=Pseudomonas sp. PA15(2017) TaxID=1932111 RepID=UPI00143ACD28|nr:hypothetical protein [Pseudomonas sp. PA15(2017)]
MKTRLARLIERLRAGLHDDSRITALVGWPGLPVDGACLQASASRRDGHDL